MPKTLTAPAYTDEHARSGLKDPLPRLETFPNQFRGYDIELAVLEYTSVCPKTGLPDCGKLTIRYRPARLCVELKSLKMYILAYRNLGIFYENAVNRVLDDLAAAVEPEWAEVKGEFTPRGGIHSTVVARYPRDHRELRAQS